MNKVYSLDEIKPMADLASKIINAGQKDLEDIQTNLSNFLADLTKGHCAKTLFKNYGDMFINEKGRYYISIRNVEHYIHILERVYFQIFKRLIDELVKYRLDSLDCTPDEELYAEIDDFKSVKMESQAGRPSKRKIHHPKARISPTAIKSATFPKIDPPAPFGAALQNEIPASLTTQAWELPTTFEGLIYAFGLEAAHLAGIPAASPSAGGAKARHSKAVKAVFAQLHANKCLSLHLRTLQAAAGPSACKSNREYALYWAYLGAEQALTAKFVQKYPDTRILPHRLSYYAGDLGIPLDNPWTAQPKLDCYSLNVRYAHQLGLNKIGVGHLAISPSSCSSSTGASSIENKGLSARPREEAKEKDSRENAEDFNLLIRKALELQLQAMRLKVEDKNQLARLEELFKMLNSDIKPKPYVAEPPVAKGTKAFKAVLYSRAKGLAMAAAEMEKQIALHTAESISGKGLKAHQIASLQDMLEHTQRFSTLLEVMASFPQPQFGLLHMQTLLLAAHQLIEDAGLFLEKDKNVLIELGSKVHHVRYHIEKQSLGRFITEEQNELLLRALNFGNKVKEPHHYFATTPVKRHSKFFAIWDELYQLSTTAIEAGEDFRPQHLKVDHLSALTSTCEELIDPVLAIVRQAIV